MDHPDLAGAPPAPGPRYRRALAAVVALALGLRLLALWQLRRSPLLEFLMGDAAVYDRWARAIAGGDLVGREVFYQSPLYPYLLAALQALGAGGPVGVRVFQALLGAASCALLARAGRRLFGPRAGLLAALLLAVYPVAVGLDLMVQKSGVEVFLLALALALLGDALEDPRPRRFGLVGLALGTLLLARESALLVALALAAWVAAAVAAPARRRAAMVLALGLGVSLPVLPVAIRNAAVGGGEVVLTTYGFGPNFYIGNARGADGLYAPLLPGRGHADYEREDATRLAEQAEGRALSPREVSRHWARAALAEIAADPSGWARLLARKWLLVWNAAEVGDTEDVYTYGEAAPAIGLPLALFHFGVLCPLAAAGLALAPRRRQAALVAGIAVTYAASVALFFLFARYRLALVPPLALLAGAGLDALPGALRERARPRLAAAGAALAVAAVAANLPLLPIGELRGPTHYNLGNHLATAGRLGEALREYDRALAEKPDHRDARFNRAHWRAQAGLRREAEADYAALAAGSPPDLDATTNLGALLLEDGRAAEAVEAFRAVAARAPTPQALSNLGVALAAAGRAPEADAAFRAALDVDPAWPPAVAGLGRLHAGQLR